MDNDTEVTGDDVFETARVWTREGRALALASVVSTWGSSPRPPGSVLLADADGHFAGSVSGGCVEGEVIRAARSVIAGGSPRLLEFGVSDEAAWSVGLACGGRMRVWVAPCPPGAVLESLAALRRQRRPALLLTSLTRADTTVVGDTSQLAAPLRDAAAAALREDRSREFEGDDESWFLHVLSPRLRLLVVGAVHIAQALAPMAAAAGYRVTVIDPRRAFATHARFPHVELRHAWPDQALAELEPDRRTAIAVLSHDAKLDLPALVAALAADAFYIGLLGSRRTLAKRCAALRERGCSDAQLARLHGPIGLDIGAATAAEIAVAILAEMTAVLRRRTLERRARAQA